MSFEIDIHKKFKGFQLDIAFHQQEKCMGILGGSGGGKSMTLKTIAGIERPDSGRIQLGDQILFDSKKKLWIPPGKRKIGYLFQNYALFPHMNVRDNIAIGMKEKKTDRMEQIEQHLKRFRLEGLGERLPGQLSGGQQQRVALARLLAYEPKMILLDEPFSALDSYLKDKMQHQLMEILQEYQGEVIMVSHSRDEIYRFCQELAILSKGEILHFGKTKELFRKPLERVTAELTGCKNISPIIKLDDYKLYAVKWGLELFTKEIIDEEVRYVGIRAHSLRQTKKTEEENVFLFNIVGKTEAPFEVEYYLSHIHSMKKHQNLVWKISKNGAKDSKLSMKCEIALKIDKEEVLLLK